MERKIGEIFEHEGKTFKVKEGENCSCHDCFFDKRCTLPVIKMTGECAANCREDNKGVVFVEVQEQTQETEKIKEREVGEVFEYQGKKLKVVETADNLCFGCYFFDGVNCQRTEREGGECYDSKRADYKPVIFVEVHEQPQEQAEQQTEQPHELNLCEILKYCPEGEPFWSPMLGDVKLHDIIQSEDIIIIEAKNRETWEINSDGTMNIGDIISPEIMLYPSKEQREWTKVKYDKKLPKSWKKFCEDNPRKKDEAYFDLCSKICILSQDYEYRDQDTDKN